MLNLCLWTVGQRVYLHEIGREVPQRRVQLGKEECLFIWMVRLKYLVNVQLAIA